MNPVPQSALSSAKKIDGVAKSTIGAKLKLRRAGGVSASRSQVLRGEKKIAWFFAERRNLRGPSRTVAVMASWATERGASMPGLSFFFVASKRYVQMAHDRNKLKRWMREAVRHSVEIRRAAALAKKERVRIYLALSVREAPSKRVKWNVVLADVLLIGKALEVATEKEFQKKQIGK